MAHARATPSARRLAFRAGALAVLFSLPFATSMLSAPEPQPIGTAINELGVQVLRGATKPADNAILSPFSIESALAMTYAGAAGPTRDELARVLGAPADATSFHPALRALSDQLAAIETRSTQQAEQMKKRSGILSGFVQLRSANRLYGKDGYRFEPAFLETMRSVYQAPLEKLDLSAGSEGAAKQINDWVAERTANKILGLVPPSAVNEATRLLLVNALYFKAPWQHEFVAELTTARPFHVGGGALVDTMTMTRTATLPYRKFENFSAVALPYSDSELQFLVLLPDAPDGLPVLEAALTGAQLKELAGIEARLVELFLPKFRLEPPTLGLMPVLKSLGLRTAFNDPQGSADFSAMAPRTAADYLYISDVLHKAFVALDELGTEAAAATVVIMAAGSAAPAEIPEPIKVAVDRPFLFAIQHRPSGTCLFLGRVTDPR